MFLDVFECVLLKEHEKKQRFRIASTFPCVMQRLHDRNAQENYDALRIELESSISANLEAMGSTALKVGLVVGLGYVSSSRKMISRNCPWSMIDVNGKLWNPSGLVLDKKMIIWKAIHLVGQTFRWVGHDPMLPWPNQLYFLSIARPVFFPYDRIINSRTICLTSNPLVSWTFRFRWVRRRRKSYWRRRVATWVSVRSVQNGQMHWRVENQRIRAN